MQRIISILAFCFVLFSAQTAFAKYWEEPDDLNNWNLSLAPGYGLLNVNGETRHGFGGRLMAGYSFDHSWAWDFIKVRMGVYDGDGDGDQGIYSTVTLTSAARYTFDLKWVFPYFYFGLGWNRTELDRETAKVYSTNSLALEPGAGVSFHIVDAFWLGLETSFIPVILGDNGVSGSFIFHGLLSFEMKI